MNLISFIRESVSQITNTVVNKLASKINRLFSRKTVPIEQIAKELLRKYILLQPEIRAVMNGDLQYELGIPDPTTRVLNIIDALLITVDAELSPIKPSGDSFKGGIIIHGIDVDYSDILNLPDAIQVTEKGTELHWLEWLLLEGTSVIVQGYEVQFGSYGRTGGARMIETGRGWGIPPKYAGTAQDNFITRAVRQMQPELREQVNRCLV